MADNPEIKFKIDELLKSLTKAFTDASMQMRQQFDQPPYNDLPFTYHMPRMQLNVKLTLSWTKDGVSGVFHRTHTSDEQEIVSAMDLEVVAAPRSD